jgi:hypothetical protein
VNGAENHGGGANAKSDGDHDRKGHHRRAEKAAECDAKVLQQILEHHVCWTDDGDGR